MGGFVTWGDDLNRGLRPPLDFCAYDTYMYGLVIKVCIHRCDIYSGTAIVLLGIRLCSVKFRMIKGYCYLGR